MSTISSHRETGNTGHACIQASESNVESRMLRQVTGSEFEVGPEFRLQTLLEIGMVDKKEVGFAGVSRDRFASDCTSFGADGWCFVINLRSFREISLIVSLFILGDRSWLNGMTRPQRLIQRHPMRGGNHAMGMSGEQQASVLIVLADGNKNQAHVSVPFSTFGLGVFY